MKDRNAWLTEHAHNGALFHYVKQTRERENTEKGRAHFDHLRASLAAWRHTYENVLDAQESYLCEKEGAVCISHPAFDACGGREWRVFDETRAQVLRELMPWRKGPFHIFSTVVDAEWRSNLKWQRLARIFDIATLCKNKSVLDVGANNLYYAFLMLIAGAQSVLAIEPVVKYAFYHEFFSIALPRLPLYFEVLGTPLEPCFLDMFDTVFCMGILYHQRNPLLCLQSLHRALKENGLIVVETICLNTQQDICLFPQQTYQNSRGYWFIPSASVVRHWLTRCHFKILAYDEPVRTTTLEQGSSDWLMTHTLENFLDSANANKTVEGYDAPFRSIVVAQKK